MSTQVSSTRISEETSSRGQLGDPDHVWEIRNARQSNADEKAEHVLERRVMAQLCGSGKGTGRLPWVGSPKFDVVIGIFITINGVLSGVETDVDLGRVASSGVASFFAVVWTLEMVLKMIHAGCVPYFRDRWNFLDFILAWFSIADVVTITASSSANAGGTRRLTILRFLRLVRLARLLKVLHAFEKLWMLVNGLVKALGLLIWTVALLILVVFVCSILTTNMIGKECEEGQVYEHWQDCYTMFGTMPRSMWTLFQVITLESWSMAVARPVIEETPAFAIFWVVFLYMTCFGLMNVVVGVIVEQTLEAKEENRERQEILKKAQQDEIIQQLGQAFEMADGEHGDGMVSLDEFLNLPQEAEQIFKSINLPVGSGPTTHTEESETAKRDSARINRRLFEVLDHNGEGELSIDAIKERAFRLKEDGSGLSTDLTLLLVEVLQNQRMLERIEKRQSAFEERVLKELQQLRGPDNVVQGELFVERSSL